MENMDTDENKSEKPIMVVKAPPAKIICNPAHFAVYQEIVNIINHLVTAMYLFSLYISSMPMMMTIMRTGTAPSMRMFS